MLRLFVGLFVISLINDGAISQFSTNLINVAEMLNWPIGIYDLIHHYTNPNTTSEDIKGILRKVEELSSKLDIRHTNLKIVCREVLEESSAYFVSLALDLENSERNLCDSIDEVDRFFDESMKYEYGQSFSNQTMESFAHKALWGDTNLPDSLDDIHESFMSKIYNSESSTKILQPSEQNHKYDCDTQMSAQQKFYYIYINLIISEMKGLAALQRIYLTKRIMNKTGDNYMAELEYAKRRFEARVTDYQRLSTKNIDALPQHIRRCDVKEPERGVNIIELQKFSRFALINSTSVQGIHCLGCPTTSELRKISTETNTTIYNCTALGHNIKSCPAEPGSHRDYLWLQDQRGNYYGHNISCGTIQHLKGDWQTTTSLGFITHVIECDMCACSIDQNRTKNVDNSTIWRISVTDQISDISNNMVVTGVKFVTYDNALHLQIHQANFSHSGLVHNNGSWKELDIGFSMGGLAPSKLKMSYEPLRFNRKTLYLDDIKAPEGLAVVGVRFQLVQDSAFKLQILVYPFELGSGKLSPIGGYWLDALDYPMRPEDYKRKRVGINLDESDDPTRNIQFQYDPESNKLIKFTHTDVYKDAGQTTIPLFDAQPVIAQPPFPLGAIGLSYKGKDGFGGYVAPRIFTIGVTNYMKSFQNSTNSQLPTSGIPSAIEEPYYEFSFIDQDDVAQLAKTKYTMVQ